MCCIYENLNFKFSPIFDLQMGEMSKGQWGRFMLHSPHGNIFILHQFILN